MKAKPKIEKTCETCGKKKLDQPNPQPRRSRKVKFSVSIDLDLINWLDKGVEDGKFKSVSDGINTAVKRLREWKEVREP